MLKVSPFLAIADANLFENSLNIATAFVLFAPYVLAPGVVVLSGEIPSV